MLNLPPYPFTAMPKPSNTANLILICRSRCLWCTTSEAQNEKTFARFAAQTFADSMSQQFVLGKSWCKFKYSTLVGRRFAHQRFADSHESIHKKIWGTWPDSHESRLLSDSRSISRDSRPTLAALLLTTTCYYLLPTNNDDHHPTTTYYYLLPTYYLLTAYLLPTDYLLTTTDYYLLPTYYLLTTTYYCLVLLTTTYYLHATIFYHLLATHTALTTNYYYLLLSTDYYWLLSTTYYCLLLTSYCLLLTAYFLLLTTFYFLLATHYLLVTTYYLLPATYYLLLLLLLLPLPPLFSQSKQGWGWGRLFGSGVGMEIDTFISPQLFQNRILKYTIINVGSVLFHHLNTLRTWKRLSKHWAMYTSYLYHSAFQAPIRPATLLPFAWQYQCAQNHCRSAPAKFWPLGGGGWGPGLAMRLLSTPKLLLN